MLLNCGPPSPTPPAPPTPPPTPPVPPAPVPLKKDVRFSWATFGGMVGYHSTVQQDSKHPDEESIVALARYPIVIIEKYQAVNTYQNCTEDAGFCQEDAVANIFQRIKEVDNTTTCLAYLNTIFTYPWYRAGQYLFNHPELWMPSSANSTRVCPPERAWCDIDWTTDVGSQVFLDACLNFTKFSYADGCFADGSDSALGSYLKGKQVANKRSKLRLLQQQVPGPIVAGSHGNCLPGVSMCQRQNDCQERRGGCAPLLNRMRKAQSQGGWYIAHMACPNLNNATDPGTMREIAAFLSVAYEKSFFMCGGWTGMPTTWYSSFDMPVGEPLADAELDGDVWVRKFSSGTISRYNQTSDTGIVEWGSLQAPVLVV